MDTKTLDKLKAILRDPDFDADVKSSGEDPETLFPRLLKQRGLDLDWEALGQGLEQLFAGAAEQESGSLDGELTDDALEMVSGGLVSSCFDICYGGFLFTHDFCSTFCR